MSRKPIIINDVDVSGCKYFEGFDCMLEPYDQEYCCRWRDNCYYKQLKRKEQEIDYCRENLHKQLDQLKEDNEILEKDKANLDVIIETLKAQFKQLKEENKDLENQLKREKDRFEKQDKFAALFIRDLQNEKASLVNEYLKKIGQLIEENEELKEIQLGFSQGENLYNLYRYKLTLQEIKEFVENEMEQNVDTSIILQKCEVLKDE